MSHGCIGLTVVKTVPSSPGLVASGVTPHWPGALALQQPLLPLGITSWVFTELSANRPSLAASWDAEGGDSKTIAKTEIGGEF